MEAHFTTARMAEREDDEGSWEDYWGGGGGEEDLGRRIFFGQLVALANDTPGVINSLAWDDTYPTEDCTMAIGKQTQSYLDGGWNMGGEIKIGTILDVLADVLPCSTHLRTLNMDPNQGSLNEWGATEKVQWMVLDEEVYQRFVLALQSSNVTAIFLPTVRSTFLQSDFGFGILVENRS
jgi:hypothetical protein